MHAAGECVRIGAQIRGHVERQQQEGAGLGIGMPTAYRGCHLGVPHHNRMHGRAKVPLNKPSRVTIGGDEVRERTQHRTVAETFAILEELGCRRREPNAFPFQCGERIHTPLQLRTGFHRRCQRTARLGIRRAGCRSRQSRAFQRVQRILCVGLRDRDLLARGNQLALRDVQRVGQLLPLDLEGFPTGLRFHMLTGCTVAIKLNATRLIAMFTHLTLQLLEHSARLLHRFPRGLLGGETLLQRFAGVGQLFLERGAITHGPLAIFPQATSERFVFFPLFLGALFAHRGAALPLLAHGEFTFQLLCFVALLGTETSQLHAAGLRRRARAMRLLAQRFSFGNCLVATGHLQL